ncbi:G protein pathway suppressor 2, partial [Galemys pyrenaicus]
GRAGRGHVIGAAGGLPPRSDAVPLERPPPRRPGREPGAHGPSARGSTMPALLERPKLSNAMARALHRHIMMERERKRQEEEEVDKMMEQKMKEEQERRKKKEMEERMSLEETKEQILKLQEKLLALQEEKHQLFLQLKKVLHEEEKRRRKEQSDMTTLTTAAYPQSLTVHTGTHLLSMQEWAHLVVATYYFSMVKPLRPLGSPGGHSRPGTLMSADRAKQMFGPQVLTVSRIGHLACFSQTSSPNQYLSCEYVKHLHVGEEDGDGKPGTMWAQQLPLRGPQSMGSFKAAQVVPMELLSPHLTMDPHSQPIALASSSEHLQHFLQCNTCLSHSHSPMQYMATFSPLKQGSSSLVVPSPCKSKWNMLTSRLASLTRPPCAPCIPKLCIQPLDSLPPPSFLCRCNQQESRDLQLPANLAQGSPSSSTARTQDSITSDKILSSASPLPTMVRASFVSQTNKNLPATAPGCCLCCLLPELSQDYMEGWGWLAGSTR